MESKICRVCLDRTATISLFDNHGDITQYRDKIMNCVSVSIEEGDGLPDSICTSCASELAISYDFKQKCEASDRALRCLSLLQTPDIKQTDLKDETLKTEIKLEPVPQDILPAPAYDNSDYENYIDFSDSKYDSELDGEVKSKHKTKNGYRRKQKGHKTKNKDKTRQLPVHLRKYKERVYTGPIQCMTCGRVLKCYSAYELHMRTHTKEKPFSCDLCKKNFTSKSTMKIHIYKHYGIDKTELKRPLSDWDGRKSRKLPPMLCIVCGLKVNSRSAMEIHMRTHTGERPYSCMECNKTYTLKGTLKRHIERHHEKVKPASNFVCEHCGKSFYTRTNIIVHLRTHTGERPYLCPFCPQTFAQLASVIRHKRVHTGDKPFTCETCGKAFRDKSLVNKHQSVHSNDRNFVCHICSKAMKSRAALKVHVMGHNNKNRFICNFCGMAFTFKGNLKLHVTRIHSEKSGLCTVCNKMFSDLQIHMRSHNGEKPCVCKLCNQGFATQRSLSHHIGFKHRDAAKFKCSTGQCDKAFPTIAMLEFHVLKAHLDSTPYVCQHCSRGFLRPSDLSRHLKMNHMDNTQVKSQFIKTVQTDP